MWRKLSAGGSENSCSHLNETVPSLYSGPTSGARHFWNIALLLCEPFDRTDLPLFIDSPLNYKVFCLKQAESTFLANKHSKWKINASGSTGLMLSSFEKGRLKCRSRPAQINFNVSRMKGSISPFISSSRICINLQKHRQQVWKFRIILQVKLRFYKLHSRGARGSLVAKALRYKPAGRGFDSRWCHWNFSVT